MNKWFAAIAGISVMAAVALYFQRMDTERIHDTNTVNTKKIDKTSEEILKNMSLNRADLTNNKEDKEFHKKEAQKHVEKIYQLESDINKSESSAEYYNKKAKKSFDEIDSVVDSDPKKINADLKHSFDNFDQEFKNF